MDDGNTGGECSRPWQSYHTVYTNAKAGMDGVDKEKVQRIVYEMSKGSKYFENEERREALIKEKIENMRAQFSKLTPADISHYQKVADKRSAELEATRDLSRIWLHVDMDAFYAAVETLSNPSLKGKPMAVGGMSMISTANYEARKFGVRAAMPGFIARKLCPDLIFVCTDFKKYTHYSDLTRKVFQGYDPNFMAASLDEAYLDITEVCKERGISGGEEIAEEIRASVFEETGLTCSAGVAPNHLLAKVCSDINKPNGQFVLSNDRMAVMMFISSLPIRKIGGIGKVTEHILKGVFGISTCQEMREKSSYLFSLFSRSTADFFLSVGLGLGKTDTPKAKLRMSISNERTFSATWNEALQYKKLAELAELLSTDMQKEDICGRTLTLKLKTASFEVRTRAMTLPKYVSSSEDILKYASKLLKAELPVSLRLIGLRMSHFNEEKSSLDPTQKKLTNFITSKDALKSIMDNPSSSCFRDNAPRLYCNMRSDASLDSGQTYRPEGDALDDDLLNQHSDNFAIGEGAYSGETDDNTCIMRNTDEYVQMHASTRHASESNVSRAPQLQSSEVSAAIQMQFADNSIGRRVKCHSSLPEDDSLPSHGEDSLWLNDYMCSICGVELPSSYVQERQEHSDFHYAKKLQAEESNSNQRPLLRQRVEKDEVKRGRKLKKAKSTGGGYIPIDHFFVRSNHSL